MPEVVVHTAAGVKVTAVVVVAVTTVKSQLCFCLATKGVEDDKRHYRYCRMYHERFQHLLDLKSIRVTAHLLSGFKTVIEELDLFFEGPRPALR